MNSIAAALRISLVFVLFVPGVAQTLNGGEHAVSIYEPLPEVERRLFIDGLRKIIALRKSGKWSELYDYVDADVPISKQQFIERMKIADSLVSFEPAAVTYIPPSDSWLVTGCAEFKKPSETVLLAFSSVRGRHTDQGWRFTDVAIERIKGEPGGIRSCRM
jgi:hypothetical protein